MAQDYVPSRNDVVAAYMKASTSAVEETVIPINQSLRIRAIDASNQPLNRLTSYLSEVTLAVLYVDVTRYDGTTLGEVSVSLCHCWC